MFSCIIKNNQYYLLHDKNYMNIIEENIKSYIHRVFWRKNECGYFY